MSSESSSSFIFPEEVGNSILNQSIYSSSAPNASPAAFGSTANVSQGAKCVKVECIYTEVCRLRESILDKDKEISRLQRETHKLKSVIEKSEITRLPSVSSYQHGGGTNHPIKKCGVSGESWLEDQGDSSRMKQPERLYKDFRARQLIRAALSDNDFLKNLDSEQVRDIVDFMRPQTIAPDDYVIREGEPGSHLYVSAEGQLEVQQEGRLLGLLGPGKAFGELALLYNCKRTATIKAISECKVWTLERRAFQMSMVKAGMRRIEDRLVFLRSVPLLKGLQPFLLARIADCLEVEYYPPGAHIIREGTAGHTFFIISQGRVKVTSSNLQAQATVTCCNYASILDLQGNTILRELSHGDYFGEQALLREERRSANVIALPPGVECLTLDRESFMQLIGDLTEFQQHKKPCSSPEPYANCVSQGNEAAGSNLSGTRRHAVETNDLEVKYGDDDVRLADGSGGTLPIDIPPSPNSSNKLSLRSPSYLDTTTSSLKAIDADFDFERLRLDDLEVVATLGVGGFGRVELVQVTNDKNRVFALKCLPKSHILATQQQEHVYAERNIMMSCKSPFIASLYCTFKDSKCIYLLMEACLGGEIWTILRDKGSFDEDTTRFVAACVVLALEYLHERDIIYRDLKPENLMVANNGCVKLVDFGFSKVVPTGQRTWTFCGTPEYVAPEVVLNRGHDRTVDYWALGVLLFELLSGLPPWGPMSVDATTMENSADPLLTYNQILKGIESINFPKSIGRGAGSIIRRLCRQIPGERLGAQRGVRDVVNHRWFQGFDWDGCKAQQIKPPIKPRLRGPRDMSNFDKFDLDVEDTPDDNSGWDIDF